MWWSHSLSVECIKNLSRLKTDPRRIISVKSTPDIHFEIITAFLSNTPLKAVLSKQVISQEVLLWVLWLYYQTAVQGSIFSILSYPAWYHPQLSLKFSLFGWSYCITRNGWNSEKYQLLLKHPFVWAQLLFNPGICLVHPWVNTQHTRINKIYKYKCSRTQT